MNAHLRSPAHWSALFAQEEKNTEDIYGSGAGVCDNLLCNTRTKTHEKKQSVAINWRGTQIRVTHKLSRGSSLRLSLKGGDIQLSPLQ